MVDGKANKIVGGRINKHGKANKGGRINKGGRANRDGKANKNSNINLMKGGKVNQCSRSPSSDVLLNYQRDLREIADNRE